MFSILARGPVARIFLACTIFSTIGCTASKPEPDDDDRMTRAILGVIAEFYGDYLESHQGNAPKDNQDFYNYLESRAEDLKLYNVEHPDQLHISHRDDRPLVIVSSKVIAPEDAPRSPWAAFEQAGVDGKIYAVRVRGGIHEFSDDEASEIFSQN